MFIRVDVAGGQATLEEPDDCKKFHVEATGASEGDLDAVVAAMGDWAAGGGDGHIWVRQDAVRRAAAGRVGDGWQADFDGMVGYAASKGWLNPAGDAIQAHVVWG